MRPQLLAATALGTTIGFLVPGMAEAAQPLYDWSGFYAGIGLNAVRSNAEIDFTHTGVVSVPASVQLPALGDGGTVRIGHNWQAGNFVLGLEGDGSVLTLSDLVRGSNYTINDSLTTLLSLRARFGVAFDRLLVYGSAGLAAGNSNFSATVTDVGMGTAAAANGTVTGVVVGLGGEYAITDKLSLTAGVDYYALSPQHGAGVIDRGYFGTEDFGADYVPRGLIFQTGVNVHF